MIQNPLRMLRVGNKCKKKIQTIQNGNVVLYSNNKNKLIIVCRFVHNAISLYLKSVEGTRNA